MTDKPNPFARLLPPVKNVVVGEPMTVQEFGKAMLESVPVNPLQTLLGDPTPMRQEGAPSNEISGSHELAAINTDSMEPKREITPSLTLKAQQRAAEIRLESGADVRALCDHVDELISSNPQLAGPPLFELRGHVMRLMVTLSSHPEFETVMIDKDTHNIMKFIRATRGEAEQLRNVKTEKKAVRQVKKETKKGQINLDGFADVFKNVMLKDFGKK